MKKIYQMSKNKNIKNIFTPDVTKQALDIMNKIIARPCAKPFINFFPDVDKTKLLKSQPMCLSLIIEKLKTHKYRIPSEWQHDMKLIHSNCSLLFDKDKDKNIFLLSNQLFLRFEKEFEFFVCYSTSKWSKLVGMLSYRLIFKMSKQMPKKYLTSTEINAVLIQNYPFIPDYSILPMKINEYQNSHKNQANKISLSSQSESEDEGPIEHLTKEEKEQHEHNCFLTAVSALKSRNDAKSIIEIIAEEQPNMNIEEPNPIISFDELEKPTVRRLIEFTKRRYIALGMKYPK